MLEAGNRLDTVEVLASKSSPGCAGARIKSLFLKKISMVVFRLLTICSTLLLLALERLQRVSHERLDLIQLGFQIPEKQLWNA